MNWRVLWSGKQDGREVSDTHYTCVSGRARLLFRCPLLVAQSTSVEAGDVAGPNELSRLISLLSLCHGLPGQGFPKFNYCCRPLYYCCRPLYAGRRHGRQRQHGFRFRISSLTGCSRGPLGYIPQAARCYIPLVPNHNAYRMWHFRIYQTYRSMGRNTIRVRVAGETHDIRVTCVPGWVSLLPPLVTLAISIMYQQVR